MSKVVDPRVPREPEKPAAPPDPKAALPASLPEWIKVKQDGTLEMEIERHGKKVLVPIDKGRTLAQKGFEADRQFQDLTRQREALGSDTEQYKSYQEYKKYLAENPRAAQAVRLALEDPDAVLSPRAPNGAADDGLDLDPAPDAQPRKTQERGASRELLEMRAKLAALEATQNQYAARDAEAVLSARLDVELASYPELQSRPRALAAAKREATRSVKERGLSIEFAASEAATDIREMLEDQGRERIAEMRKPTAPVGGPAPGIPVPFEEKPITRHAKPGDLLNRVRDRARSFGFLPPKR